MDVFTSPDVNSPSGAREGPLRMLLFDSWYDHYRGVICLVAVTDGSVGVGQYILVYLYRKDIHVQHSILLQGMRSVPLILDRLMKSLNLVYCKQSKCLNKDCKLDACAAVKIKLLLSLIL